MMRLSIIDYQRFSGRYKRIGSDNKVLEYDYSTNELLFEGEYANGRRHGYGIQYNEEKKYNLKENI